MTRDQIGQALEYPHPRRVKTYPDGAQEYEVPKKWVKVNASRILSDAQREAALKNAEAARKAKFG